MEITRLEKFYKIHARFYDYTRPLFLLNRRKAINFLNVQPNDKVIDFACGTGLNIALLLTKAVNGKIIGIDYAESMLKVAKRHYPKAEFIQGDISEFRFKEPADKIICTYSLSMTEEWQKAIINMKSALKPEGILVILDFHYPWRRILRVFYPVFKWWLQKHGVDPEKPIIEFLKRHFDYVEERVLNFGYNYIAIVKSPS